MTINLTISTSVLDPLTSRLVIENDDYPNGIEYVIRASRDLEALETIRDLAGQVMRHLTCDFIELQNNLALVAHFDSDAAAIAHLKQTLSSLVRSSLIKKAIAS